MTGRQKWILALMGLLDLAVVIMLGSVVLLAQHTPPVTEMPPTASCGVMIGQSLPDTLHPQVSVASSTLTIALAPDSGDTQTFWEVLDVLATLSFSRCPTPKTILIILKWPEGNDIARIDGDDFRAWAEGQLSDMELAEKARYRHFTAHP